MGTADEIAKILPIDQVYKDLAQPAVREIGTAMGNAAKVFRFALAPVDFLATYHTRFQRYLERLAEKVPEERRVEAPPQVVGPIIANMRYVEEDGILAELFLNLLARAIDRERVGEAHPAFSQLVGQLSPDEALIIFRLTAKAYKIRQHWTYDSKKHLFNSRQTESNEFPINDLSYPNNFWLYMDHLHAMGIAGTWQDGKQEPVHEGEGESRQQVGLFINYLARLTPFGKSFATACVPDTLDSRWLPVRK